MTTMSFPSPPSSHIKDDPRLQQLLQDLDSANISQQFQWPRSPSKVAAPSSDNPIHNEPKLEKLLTKLDLVNSNEQFQRWRNSFLKEFEAFLNDADKTAKAELIFADFGANLAKLTMLLKQLQGFLENGDLTADTCTVKARHGLTEVNRQTNVVILQTEALVPGTTAEEKKAGFTKFNVGAALIRDGFVQYGRLLACTEVLEHFRTKTCLAQVADRQILQTMELHGIKARIFCDVMADLGIFKVMIRCRELDVTEMDDNAGELEPHELEDDPPQAPALPPPPPPVSPPRSPLTPTRPKKKKPAKIRTPKPPKTPPKSKMGGFKEFVVLSIPAAKGSQDKTGKAVSVRRKGPAGNSSPAEEKRNEEDQ